MVGIYKITNLENGKVYVGQSKNIKFRWYAHRGELNRNVHHNSHLQNAWNNYGSDSFRFQVIEECDERELNDKEIYWISHLKSSDPKYGYNMTTGGDGGRGRILSEEQKYHMFSIRADSEEIVQLSLDGKFIKRWRSSAQAAKTLNIPASGIRECVRDDGGQFQCRRYIWISAKKYDNGLFNFDEYSSKYLQYYRRPICQYDLYGNLINRCDSQETFAKDHPEMNRQIKRLLTHKVSQDHGNIYIYEDESDMLTDGYLRNCRIKSSRYKVKQFDLNNNYIKTYTIEELSSLPYRVATIKKVCYNRYAHIKNGIKKAFGYIWEYD